MSPYNPPMRIVRARTQHDAALPDPGAPAGGTRPTAAVFALRMNQTLLLAWMLLALGDAARAHELLASARPLLARGEVVWVHSRDTAPSAASERTGREARTIEARTARVRRVADVLPNDLFSAHHLAALALALPEGAPALATFGPNEVPALAGGAPPPRSARSSRKAPRAPPLASDR